MTHWYTGNEVPANVHTLGFSGAAMTSSNPAAELVLLVTGYRVSQAIHVAATLGIADMIKDGAASASDLAIATNSHAGTLYRVLRALAASSRLLCQLTTSRRSVVSWTSEVVKAR